MKYFVIILIAGILTGFSLISEKKSDSAELVSPEQLKEWVSL